VPQRGYLDHVGGGTTDADINVFGPIARGAEDLDLLMDVIAGPEPERALAWRLELPEPRQSAIADFRVGVWFEEPGMPIDRDQLELLRRAADALSDAGAKVEEAHPDVSFDEQRGLFHELIVAAISPSMDEDVAESSSGSHLAWLRADKRRARLRSAWANWFETYDTLLCPVLPVPAFPHNQAGDFLTRTVTINGEEQPYLLLTSWTGLIGIVGLPSAVAPIGRVNAGVPVGVQVVAPFLRDREAVRLAGLLAEACGGGYQVPPGFAA
jgi:amidase